MYYKFDFEKVSIDDGTGTVTYKLNLSLDIERYLNEYSAGLYIKEFFQDLTTTVLEFTIDKTYDIVHFSTSLSDMEYYNSTTAGQCSGTLLHSEKVSNYRYEKEVIAGFLNSFIFLNVEEPLKFTTSNYEDILESPKEFPIIPNSYYKKKKFWYRWWQITNVLLC